MSGFSSLDPKPDSSERRELQTVLGMLVLADRFQVPGFGEVFETRLRQLIRFDSSMATGLMTCTGLGLPWNTEYKQCLAKASSAAANPKNIEVDDALQQVEERVLQHIPADAIKGLAARAWVFYLLAAKIQLSMKGKKEAERLVIFSNLLLVFAVHLTELPNPGQRKRRRCDCDASE